MVTSSDLVADGGVRVSHVSRSHVDAWMFLSGLETDGAVPMRVHFDHLVRANPSLSTLRLGRGQYALRSAYGDDWYIFGPVDDDEYDRLVESGVIADQHTAIEHGHDES